MCVCYENENEMDEKCVTLFSSFFFFKKISFSGFSQFLRHDSF